MRICIVSPHLDDAILSCGILMQRHRILSDEILCLNIFTAGTLSESRTDEDRKAMRRIGAIPHYLDELDAPDRNRTYQNIQDLFFGRLDEADGYIDHVERRVRDFLGRSRIDVAYFPLAAGGHIDHRIAYEIGKRVKTTAVRFYEDRPYILWPGVLQGRMNSIGADAGLPDVTVRSMRESMDAYYYLRRFVPPGKPRDAMLPLYLAATKERLFKNIRTKSEELAATEEETRVLYECLTFYRSQMNDIYPDYDTLLADSSRYERVTSGRDGYIERSWTLMF